MWFQGCSIWPISCPGVALGCGHLVALVGQQAGPAWQGRDWAGTFCSGVQLASWKNFLGATSFQVGVHAGGSRVCPNPWLEGADGVPGGELLWGPQPVCNQVRWAEGSITSQSWASPTSVRYCPVLSTPRLAAIRNSGQRGEEMCQPQILSVGPQSRRGHSRRPLKLPTGSG